MELFFYPSTLWWRGLKIEISGLLVGAVYDRATSRNYKSCAVIDRAYKGTEGNKYSNLVTTGVVLVKTIYGI